MRGFELAAIVRCHRVIDRTLSNGPSINVNGVRNSWLTLLKNAVFARSISANARRGGAPLHKPAHWR
jgi:hypothetical protein